MTTESKASQAGYLISNTLRRRSTLLVLLALILVLSYPLGSPFLPTTTTPTPLALGTPDLLTPQSKPSSARAISAHDLLSRPLAVDKTSIPKLIHQTWFPAGSNMSSQAQKWVETIKTQNAGWEYLLWDDETDELLVRTYFPWFLETYKSLPKEINRADMARNFYLFLFGGMYADVDTEALRPISPLFASHDVTLKPHTEMHQPSSPSSNNPIQRAFMARMAHTLDPLSLGAVPNGWMASPPGHPFWLLSVLAVMENPKGDGSVEGMTGPGILGPIIKQYFSTGRNGMADGSLRRQLCARVQSVQPSWDLYCPRGGSLDAEQMEEEAGHSLVLLPREQIYPFSWVDDGDVKVCLGAKGNSEFDAEACKKRMGVNAWPSYFITYCTHTW